MDILVEIRKNQEAVAKHVPKFVDTEEWRESVVREFENDLRMAPLQYKAEIHYGFSPDSLKDRTTLAIYREYLKKIDRLMFVEHYLKDRVYLSIFLNPPVLDS